MGCDWESLIKAGICGICSLILVPLGVIFLIPGIVLIAVHTDSGFRAGIGFLITAALFLLLGFWMCYYTWKKIWNDPTTTSQPGLVIQTPASQPLMTNSQPQPGVSTSIIKTHQQPSPQGTTHYIPQQVPNQAPPPGVAYPQGQAPGVYPPGSYPQQGGGYGAPGLPPSNPHPGQYDGYAQGYVPPNAPPPYTQAPALPSKM